MIKVRPFAGAGDHPAMSALALRLASQHVHIADLPYRFSSWALDDPRNAAVWADERGEVRAWAVLQSPFWMIDFATDPAAGDDLLRQVLGWVDERIRQVEGTRFSRPAWFAAVLEDQSAVIRTLESAGFTSQAEVGEDSWNQVLLHRSATEMVEPACLPEGFVLRPLAGLDEVEVYVQLHQAVFQSKNMTVEWRARVLQQTAYQPDLDLVIAAPDGRLAAFGIFWMAQAGGVWRGQVEPLGVHADFQRLGLGKALLLEGLRRMAQKGAAEFFIETDRERNAALGLYEAAGFKVLKNIIVFRKDR